MSNTCSTVLIENCHPIHATEFDHGEDIIARLIPAADTPGLVASGAIKHALVVAALFHFELSQREKAD
jgi:hypothetical protein